MEELEMIAFEIISNVGTARSCFIDAIRLAKEGKYDEAKSMVEDGDKAFMDGHAAHMKLLKVKQDQSGVGLLVIHAEDQLMSAETFKLLAMEFIDLYKKVEEK